MNSFDSDPSAIERYSRQLILKNWSSRQQQKLEALTVFVSHTLPASAIYLAAAGVGKIHFGGSDNFVRHIELLNPNVVILNPQEDSYLTDCSIVHEINPDLLAASVVSLKSTSAVAVISRSDTESLLLASTIAACRLISLVK